jgi:hypothetical protein
MLQSTLKRIFERVLKEYPKFGSIEITLIFHDCKFVGHEFTKTEKAVVKKEE